MFELLHTLSDWIIGFADSPWSVAALAVTSFTESIFNPIPPDPLLIGISIRHPGMALWLAALATVTSVLGALVGHWLGLRFGRPIVLKFISEKKVDRVERMFQSYGAWAVLLAAFTPIPYKVFAITAGILELKRRPFIIASVIGRGARFLLIGALVFLFGESIQEFIDARFELLTILFSVALIVSLVVVLYIARRRRARNMVPLGQSQPGNGD